LKGLLVNWSDKILIIVTINYNGVKPRI